MITEINDLISSKLRFCQLESIETIQRYLESRSERSCLISLPTGAGKSGVICTVGHFSSFEKILVVTHRRAVCDQLYKQLKGKFFQKILQEDVDYKQYLTKKIFNQINNTDDNGIYCTTFQKITSLSEEELTALKNIFSLILIDEGHAEPSPKWGAAIRELNARKVIITATPYRNDLFSFDIDPDNSYIYSYKDAIKKGDIISPNFETIDMPKDIVKADFNIIYEKINTIKEKQPDAVCIIKCKEFQDIELFFSKFQEFYRTAAIHDQFKDKEIEDTYRDVPANLAELSYEVLIHQRKLDEGIDIPEAKILILTYPVGSGKELVQTIGRVVRIYQDYQPIVLDISTQDNQANKDVWKNYLAFDEYISNSNSAKNFLETLDTALLVERYLDVFPEHSYFGSCYRKKFDFNEFNPILSLEIPLASVCFYYKLTNFSLNDCIDKLYWEFNREGALSKYDIELGVVTSVCFNNSKFLKDSLFFEPSLEIMIIKEIGDIIAIFDSRGRKFNGRDDLKIGRSIDVDKLFSVVAETKKTRTKQANTRALQLSQNRPESISLKSTNLEAVNHSQSNSAYAVTTAIVSNIDDNNDVTSTYYLGVGSGRICDQTNKKLPYDKFIEWIENINILFAANQQTKSAFLNSYSQAIKYIPEDEPTFCILDLTNFIGVIEVGYNGRKNKIDNDFIYKRYTKGISFFNLYYQIDDDMINECKNYISFLFNEKKEISAICDDEIEFFIDGQKTELNKIFNNDTVQLLFKDGTTFLHGNFFKHKLPTERNELNHNIINNIIPLDCLLSANLSEKDEDNVLQKSFSSNSIFYLIDQMSNVKNPNISLNNLGQFFEYLPNVDLMLCTDMGTEPADFILSSKDRVIFVHVKCGDSSKSPQSSAGALCLVGGQALKNLHFLLNNSPSKYGNITNIRGAWPAPEGNGNGVCLDSRIRLFNKTFNLSHSLDDVIETIDERRIDPRVRKEIWLVIGNAFSYKHFMSQLNSPSTAKAETVQAYQLLDTWFSQTSSHDVDMKIFVSP
ncbi:DEAD/DEAH box helicase [Acinetobacter baumannii]|nr:DEAD/DEAH box helicase family protein [Acinetobacter baumannii]